MVAPLSAKLNQKMQLDKAKALFDKQCKQELQEIKLQDAEAKANLGILFKTRDQIIKEKQKLADSGIQSPVPPLPAVPQASCSMDTPTNPEAGPSDTVVTKLTPGEAVIPANSAQDPKNKAVIAQLVDEGRQAQGYKRGTVSIPKPTKGLTGMTQQENMLPIIPVVGRRKKMQGYQAGTTGETDYTAQTAEDQRKAKVVASKSLYPLAALADTFIGRNTNAISKGVSWLANAAGVPRMVRALGGTLPDDGVKLPVIGNGGVSPFSEGAIANAERFAPTAVTPQVPKTAPAVTTAAPTPLAHMPEVGGSSELSPALRALISADAQKEGIPNPVANFKGTKGGAWRVSTEPEPAKAVPQVPVRGVTPINFGVIPAETPVPTTAAAIKPIRFTEEKMSSLLRDLAPKAASIVAAAAEVPPEDKRSFIEKGMGSLFGEQGVFRPEDAVRLAVLFGAGVATGGSVNGSLKYAGLDALKHMDAREASETTARATAAKELRAAKQARLSKEEEREYNERNWRFQQEYKRLADAGVKDQELAEWEYKQRVEETNRGKTAAAKTNFDVLSKRIDETFENQAITPRIRRELQNRLLNGDHVTVARILDRPEVIENEMQMVGNVAPGTKPVLMTPIGQEDRVETFKNRDGNLVSRNKAGKWVINNPTGWQEAPATQRTPDESAKAGAEMFDKRLFEKDGDKPPALDQKAATAQLGDFLRKEWSRGHPVAGPALVSSLNIMMEKAKRSGEKDINVSKLLDMLTIHPASLADEEKLLLKGSKDKQVPVHYFGSMYDRIKKVVTNDADNFMSDISLNYDKSKDYYKVDDLDPSNPYSIAIKESPNNWWAYVNRKLYDKQRKK